MSFEKIDLELADKTILNIIDIYISQQDNLTQDIYNEQIEELILSKKYKSREQLTLEQIKDILFHTIISHEINIFLEQELNKKNTKDMFEK